MNMIFFATLAMSSYLVDTHQDKLASTTVAAAKLDAATKAETLNALVKDMDELYIFPDVAKKIGATLKVWMTSDEYSGMTDPAEFTSKVNEILKKEVTDAHLRFRYSESVLPKREKPTEPSNEELNRYKEQTRYANSGFDSVKRLSGNLGYIEFSGFWSQKDMERPMEGAMKFLSNVDAMIVDLRHNGGGDPAGVQLFCSYFFDPKPVHLNNIFFRDGDKVEKTEYWTLKKLPAPRLPDVPLFVLTSKRTASGAEECAYDFQQLKRATIIGESTWGGANPGDVVRLSDHFSCFIPVGRANNPYSNTNWEGTGVLPDVKVAATDALRQAQMMALKGLIEKSTDEQRKSDLKEILDEVVNGS